MLKYFSLVFAVIFCVLLIGCETGKTDSNVKDTGDEISVFDEQVNWLKGNTHSLTSLYSENYEDLHFLKPLLEDKRILFFG
ncbi:hypothetical protein ACW2QC_10910 [Virgibacillus sp. FSP13]